ncbi:MAG: ABC transporter permease [Chloroflexi bacterium]|nr:ABC transporter permease [Chloroflexota bacterium]
MNSLLPSLWAETLKMRRSKVPLVSAIGFSMAPLAGGLFMVILKDPEAARAMGLISAKAQLMVGVADWPAYFGFLSQAIAAGGMVLFSIITIWVFGREFSDRTAKELLALPTSREATVTAKFIVIAAWSLAITLLIFGIGLLVGALVVLPAWSTELLRTSFINILGAAALTIPLMSFVALLASTGRGYLLPFGWTIFTLFLANISAIMGWGGWFPWAVPGLFSGMAGSRAEFIGPHSYAAVIITSLIGLAATFYWWRNADQTR